MARRPKVQKKKDTSFATWKFDIENTLNADPLADGECLKIMRAYLDWMGTPDARPYLSLTSLRVLTGLADNTIGNRRRLLVKLGYFEESGKTSTGATRYRIVNARKNLVLDHQTVMREKLLEMEAEKKAVGRSKRATLSPSRYEGQNGEMPLTACGDRPSPHEGNYVYYDVESISMEREGYSKGYISSPDIAQHIPTPDRLAQQQTKGEASKPVGMLVQPLIDAISEIRKLADFPIDAPFPTPANDAEAENMVSALCADLDISPFVHRRLKSMLATGVLTPRMAFNILGRRDAA